MLGSKEKARLNVCPSYEPQPSTIHGLRPEIYEGHETLKSRLLQIYSERGYECQTEPYVCENRSTGRVDILCSRDSEVLVIECKSYSPHGLNLVDLMQLAEYHRCVSSKFGKGKNVKALLAYYVAPDNILLIEVGEDVLKESLPQRVEKIIGGPGVFVVSSFCNYCNRRGCVVHA